MYPLSAQSTSLTDPGEIPGKFTASLLSPVQNVFEYWMCLCSVEKWQVVVVRTRQ